MAYEDEIVAALRFRDDVWALEQMRAGKTIRELIGGDLWRIRGQMVELFDNYLIDPTWLEWRNEAEWLRTLSFVGCNLYEVVMEETDATRG